ncbi:hypothetical protein [Haladaptatus sp. NG-WS-4]
MTTGTDGRATVTYHLESVSGTDDVEVRASIDDAPPADGPFDAERKETLAFSLVAVDRNGDGNGGSGGSAADVEYVDASGVAKANGGQTTGVQFSFINTGERDVTVTGITVDANKDSSAKYVSETNGGEGSDGQHEVCVDASDDGWLEMDCSNCNDPGTNHYQLGTKETLTEPATVVGGSEATVYVYEFKKNNGNAEPMSGKEMVVTVHFADGSSKTFEFTAREPY